MGSKKAPVSTTELAERAEEPVRSLHDNRDAVVVLQGSEPAAVLIGATEFAALCENRRRRCPRSPASGLTVNTGGRAARAELGAAARSPASLLPSDTPDMPAFR